MNKKIEIRFKNQANSKTFKNLTKLFNLNNKSVLDIGCSYGEHLIHFGEQSMGVTISEDEVRYGRSRGLNIKYGNIESDDLNIKNRFDVIFANNILEHLYSPHIFLCKIKKYLNKDGILILGVPCAPSIKLLMHIKKFRGSLAVAHINFFTKYTLFKTVERSGWEIMDIRGFRIKNKIFDKFLNPIYPHLYVIAKVDKNFDYREKRMKELIGEIISSSPSPSH
ncbi:hypothetical protein A2Y83_00865 [Candidatus Falkowbacteria bacterium RBG_13_39_14]|uniref:Methyltransferase domain-containing protein n=1 Tax=Candidatus Falkowbacteria bacterium RBG_13_39_14 TaxID=1797985 RepID=A0A1F5S8X6_9BACT|nr:MAG: hypothetical protein A2Y83_00865 [Candidatus Falkowbacteria bacterium RBG_13_39_14]